jgi:hypothetical protein
MVRLFVGVTDKAWFDQLSASVPHDDVNFWRPSGTTQFRALQPGELFLFKLHAPTTSSLVAAFSAKRQSRRCLWPGRPLVPRTAFPVVLKCGRELRVIAAIRLPWTIDTIPLLAAGS